ncbi:MAG: hypothetical protein R2860_06165 [Desulfobacterales bacterium]
MDLLQKYNFPGNIRELENLIERSVALSSTNIILPDSLSLSIHKRRWIEGSKTGAMMWMMWKKGRSGHDIRRN